MLATICYLKRDGRTLMLDRSRKKEDYQRNVWNAPGGKVEGAKTLDECVAREVLHETGLRISNAVFLGIVTYFAPDEEDYHVAVYTTAKFSGKLTGSDEGDPVWVDDTKLLTLNLWPGDIYLLPWVDRAIKEKKLFFATIRYDERRNVMQHAVRFQ